MVARGSTKSGTGGSTKSGTGVVPNLALGVVPNLALPITPNSLRRSRSGAVSPLVRRPSTEPPANPGDDRA